MYLRRIIVFLLLLPLFLPGRAQDSSLKRARQYLERAVNEPDSLDAVFFYRKALDCYWESIRTMPEKVSNRDYWDAATAAVSIGSRDTLTILVRTALDRTVSSDGVVSEAYAKALQEVARKCLLAGDLRQAWRFLKRSDKLFKKVETGPYDGRDIALWRDATTIRATLLQKENQFKKALKLADKLIDEEKKQANNTRNLYRALLLAGNIADDGMKFLKADKYSKEAFYLARPMVVQAFNQMSEAARDRFWRKNRKDLEGSDIPRFDYLLLSKGILLKASKDFNEMVLSRGDSLAREMLAALNQATVSGAPPDTLEAMDQRLVNHLTSLGIEFSSPQHLANQQDIQAVLNEDDLVIEFFATKEGGYVAALLKKDWKGAKYEGCGLLFHGEWPFNILQYFPTTEKGRVFFSADRELNNMGIEYFPFKDKGIIAEIFPMYRLSTTREILPRESKGGKDAAGLYGGVLFDVRQRQRQRMLDSLKLKATRNLDLSVSGLPPVDDSYEGLKPLPESLAEIQAIDSILRFAGVPVNVQTGAYASEDYFKELSPEENNLHLATHGFYVRASELDRYPYFAGLFGRDLEKLPQDPLLRTGLYLAGANQSLRGSFGPYEDGVLTAKEISMMDLRDVELVVLSACKTGLGEHGADGVFGLQRAFKKAGVQSIVMTLRRVSDTSSAFLMKTLYENRYLLGLSLHDAFYAAVRQLREREICGQFSTHDWDAFILLDAYLSFE